MAQRKEEPRKGLTVGDLRLHLATLDTDLPVQVVHVGAPYIAALPVQDVQHWAGDGAVLHLTVGRD